MVWLSNNGETRMAKLNIHFNDRDYVLTTEVSASSHGTPVLIRDDGVCFAAGEFVDAPQQTDLGYYPGATGRDVIGHGRRNNGDDIPMKDWPEISEMLHLYYSSAAPVL
jgi:hypothetical protein